MGLELPPKTMALKNIFCHIYHICCCYHHCLSDLIHTRNHFRKPLYPYHINRILFRDGHSLIVFDVLYGILHIYSLIQIKIFKLLWIVLESADRCSISHILFNVFYFLIFLETVRECRMLYAITSFKF